MPADSGSGAADVLAAVRNGDEAEFGRLLQPHRRELRVHCYRMVGSYDDAEDLVQETFLRAWRRRETFQGRASLRAWLYKVATNTCLEQLRRTPRPTPVGTGTEGRLPPYSAMPWIQPYPDARLDEPAPMESQPDAVVVRRETIALAFLAAIQLLPPRQRAVLLLRDVLAFSAAETADLLELSVPAANSALQRARATLAGYQDAAPTAPAAASVEERALLERYMRAHERADPAAIIAVLQVDARLTVSPAGMAWQGRDQIAPSYRANMGSLGEWRCVATAANRQPAVAHYLRRFGDDTYRAFSLVVLDIRGSQISEIATFTEPGLFPAFGLASALP